MLSLKAGAGGSFWEATYSARLMEYGQFDGWSANRLTPLSQPINHSPLHMPVVGQICGLFHALLGGSFNYLHSCKHSSCTILTLFPGRPLPASFPGPSQLRSQLGPSQLRSQLGPSQLRSQVPPSFSLHVVVQLSRRGHDKFVAKQHPIITNWDTYIYSGV